MVSTRLSALLTFNDLALFPGSLLLFNILRFLLILLALSFCHFPEDDATVLIANTGFLLFLCIAAMCLLLTLILDKMKIFLMKIVFQ